jgi:hypothetical protein
MFNTATSLSKALEEQRLWRYKQHTLRFWDAFLKHDPAAKAYLDDLVAQTASDSYVHSAGVKQPTRAFIIRASDGTPLVQFQGDGNVIVLEGEFKDNEASISPTSSKEFILRNSQGNAVAIVDETFGDFKLKGSVVFSPELVPTSARELVIMNGTTAQLLVDESGVLKLRGGAYDFNKLYKKPE